MTSDEMTSNEAAGPGRKYKLPSEISQLISVFGAQMRLYSKSKVAIAFIILALVIPVLAYSGAAETIIKGMIKAIPSTSYLLILLPLFTIAIPAMMAGRILSSEFANRTAYLLFTLPVSRTTYYLGKFLAALTLSIGVFAMAYAFAVICGSGMYGPSYPNDVLSSFVMCAVGVFALTAMAYGLSTYFKKGSTGLVISMMIFLPMIILALRGMTGDLDLSEGTGSSVFDPLMMLPPFTGYQSLYLIDNGIGGTSLRSLFKAFIGPYPLFAYLLVSIIWGTVFLILGMLNVKRKEL
ncbi:MAG: ABC transporter permease [Methanomassiliicoccaceae archaeon]|jgi:ABC-type transport system involved in multi-copper enzyme maturation permease subunit|nr:ABC transporter permease [Methanomassiliicoccaceae archaeon]